MSFLFKWLTGFFFTEEDIYEDKMNCEGENVDDKMFNEAAVDSSSVPCGIIRKSGVVTFISDNYGLIDNVLYFDLTVVPKLRKLTVGETVKYAAVKANENETERILEIEEAEEDFFENENKEILGVKNISITNSRDDSLPDSTERVLNGKISVKQGEDLFIHPLNIHCSLRNVKCDFIPIEGDWVSVVVDAATDQDALNLAGEILHIKYLMPLLVRNKIGTVTYLNSFKGMECEGVIENEIFFSTRFCQLDFLVTLGEQVAYMAVESDQGSYKWRALTLQPTSEAEAGDRSTETRDLLRDKDNIVIEGNLNIGPLEIGQMEEAKLTVKNNGEANQVIQRSSWKTNKRTQLVLKTPETVKEILLKPGDSIDFIFQCTAKFLGLSSEIFVFHFKNFNVGRRFHVNVSLGKAVSELISWKESDENRIPRKASHSWKNFDLTGAVCCKSSKVNSRFRSNSRKYPMGRYDIPEKLFKVVLGENEVDNTRSGIKKRILKFAPYLKSELSVQNYKEKFHTMLYLEEINHKIMYRKYDLKGVILRKRDKYFALDVSNVADNSTLFPTGTSVVVTQPWSEVNTEKQVGYVQENRDGILLVIFHESFHARYDESDCDVFFQPIRAPFLRCHKAVDMVVEQLGMNWLFPKSIHEKPPIVSLKRIPSSDGNPTRADLDRDVDENGFVTPWNDGQRNFKWFNPNLNHLQKAAVVNVLEGRCRPLPYIIFGPPGTGKTVTIVEIILQAYTLISDSRILVGAPSNSATDIICHYLISTGKFTPGQLVRLLSRCRAASGDIPEYIIPFCSTMFDDGQLESKYKNVRKTRPENVDCIGTQRIVISTCNTIDVLHSFGLSPSHFTHIIVDEAAQAYEPESLIPICFLDPKRGQIVLSGDSQQLGPVCTAFKDSTHDLSRSFLWRLCESKPYTRNHSLYSLTQGFDPRCITRLQVNYRSVPEILELPSRLFYDSELIATVSQEEGPEAEMIRRFNFDSDNREKPPAIIFHGVCGESYRDEGSYSCYNPLEIWQTVCYLKRLYSMELTPEEIGIITPYQKQVEKIRRLLSEFNLPVPKVGSVEEFQGQERYAIILSTVRSTTKNEDNNLGFLACPRRVNVAITRARAILIIIGNPFILRQDPYWSAVIQYCMSNNSCTGCSFESQFPKGV